MSAGAASIPASPLASPLASPGQISSGLIVIPTVPMRFARWLPPWYARRATVWIPNHVRAARNWALYFTFAEVFVSLVCCGLAGVRGSISKASAGIHGWLLVVSVIGFAGVAKLWLPATALHAVLAMGTPAIFALFLILTLTVSQGYRDSGDAIIILVFLALVLDFLSGCVSFYYGARLYMYERACKKADDATAAAALVAAASPPSTAGAALSPPVSAAAMPAMPDTAAARAARRLGLQEQVVEGGAVVPPNVASSFVHLLPADAVPVPASPNAGATAVHAPASQPVMPMHSSALADSGLCAICMELPRNTAFYPCGHMCCAGCASTLMRHSTHCHLCRRRITSTLRVYL